MADQTFFPVMEEGKKGKKKRLVLTTVRDNQNTVQIDLYKSSDKSIDPGNYVGSLVIENIENAPKGTPEIEVILGIDEHNNLNAVARNLQTGIKQRLQTSLENLEEYEVYDIPDFELEDEGKEGGSLPARDRTEQTGDRTIVGNNYPIDEKDRRRSYLKDKEQDKSPVGRIVFITLGLLLIAGLAIGVIYFINNNMNRSLPHIEDYLTEQDTKPTANETKASAQPTQLVSTAPEITVEPSPTAVPEPTAVTIVTSLEPTAITPTNKTVKINGVEYYEYTIVWGDTLWWLANKYYGNPWLYKKIYRYQKNSLKDPDLIIAGTKLYIPKK
jgi:nucleoid-associated protein YgaU